MSDRAHRAVAKRASGAAELQAQIISPDIGY
jgi:hypothetical protein